jgi:hypothetical protein
MILSVSCRVILASYHSHADSQLGEPAIKTKKAGEEIFSGF